MSLDVNMSSATDDHVDMAPEADWKPPTGRLSNFYYRGGAPITRSQMVSMFNSAKIREYKGHKEKVHSVAWNADGRRLASGSVDKTARVWSPQRSTDVKYSTELKGHTGSVDQLDWNPTHPDRLATASSDQTVRIWDQRSGKCTAKVDTEGENINICWSPDGNDIAVGDKNDKITFIDTRTNQIKFTKDFRYEVNEFTWNLANNLFCVTTGQGNVELYDYPSFEQIATGRGHTSSCYSVEADPSGNYLAAGSADGSVSLWDMESMNCVRSFGKLTHPVRTLSFSFDAQYIAYASEDHFIDISHVQSGESVKNIECSAAMNTVAWSPRDYYLAYAGDEIASDGKYAGNLRIFSMKDPREQN